jgi:excisionase family DNA binding protein
MPAQAQPLSGLPAAQESAVIIHKGGTHDHSTYVNHGRHDRLNRGGPSIMDAEMMKPAPSPRASDDHVDTRPTVDLSALPLLLAVPRAARLLGISRSAAYRLAETGELPVRRLGGRIYVVTAKLLDLVEAA